MSEINPETATLTPTADDPTAPIDVSEPPPAASEIVLPILGNADTDGGNVEIVAAKPADVPQRLVKLRAGPEYHGSVTIDPKAEIVVAGSRVYVRRPGHLDVFDEASAHFVDVERITR